MSEQRRARHDQLAPVRRDAARRLVGGSLRSYGAMALLAAAAGALNGKDAIAIFLVVLGLVLVGVSFRVKPRAQDEEGRVGEV